MNTQVAGAVVLVLLLAGCGGGGSDDDDDDFSGISDNFGGALLSWTPITDGGAAQVWIGEPGAGGSRSRGRVRLYTIAPDGTGTEEGRLGEREGGFIGDVDGGDGFGSALAPLNDLNGDGVRELAIGMPFDDDGPDSNRGAVWVVYLDEDLMVWREEKISSEVGGLTSIPYSKGFFGAALASPGDVDGDAIHELAVGSPGDNDGGADVGAVWILFLNRDAEVRAEQKISATAGNFTGELDNEDEFGSALAAIGDLDGDSISELAVGAPRDEDDDGREVGAVWILFLDSSARVREQQKISLTAGGFGGTLEHEDCFGGSLAALSDLNRDGVVDVAVGAPGDNDNLDRGAVWILFLEPDGTVQSEQKIAPGFGNFTGELRNGDFFGGAVAALTDLDEDGVRDLTVGVPGWGSDDNGAVWVLFMQETGRVEAEAFVEN